MSGFSGMLQFKLSLGPDGLGFGRSLSQFQDLSFFLFELGNQAAVKLLKVSVLSALSRQCRDYRVFCCSGSQECCLRGYSQGQRLPIRQWLQVSMVGHLRGTFSGDRRVRVF
jgi:glycosyltransferase A (GT-A) superfamily protein (DUF2064 family)